jgi:type IV pilus assembly protein PilV
MNKSNGFTLIEVLVATLVLAVGLLGLLGLQAASIKNNLSAYNRSQATQLAYDMADRMRANKNESLDPTSGNVIATSTYLTMALKDAADQKDCAKMTGCTGAQMAQNDLFQWRTALTNTLPSSEGTTITVDAATRVFTITVKWDDSRHVGGNASDPDFSVSFQL